MIEASNIIHSSMDNDTELKIISTPTRVRKEQALFKGINFLAKGFEKDQCEDLLDLIKQHEGMLFQDLTDESTLSIPEYVHYVLVPHGHQSPKSASPPSSVHSHVFVTVGWLERCIEAKKIFSPNLHAVFSPFPSKVPYQGCKVYKVSITNFEGDQRKNLKMAIITLGFVYKERLEVNTSAKPSSRMVILISSNPPTGKKCQYAHTHGIPVVKEDWIRKSIENGSILPHSPFLYPSSKLPEKLPLLPLNPPRPPPSPILLGATIYVRKLEGNLKNEIYDLATSLGATIAPKFNDGVTHIIQQGSSSRYDKSSDLFRKPSLPSFDPHHHSCKVVNPLWLMKCKEDCSWVDESHFPPSMNPKMTLGMNIVSVPSPSFSSLLETPAYSHLKSTSNPSLPLKSKLTSSHGALSHSHSLNHNHNNINNKRSLSSMLGASSSSSFDFKRRKIDVFKLKEEEEAAERRKLNSFHLHPNHKPSSIPIYHIDDDFDDSFPPETTVHISKVKTIPIGSADPLLGDDLSDAPSHFHLSDHPRSFKVDAYQRRHSHTEGDDDDEFHHNDFKIKVKKEPIPFKSINPPFHPPSKHDNNVYTFVNNNYNNNNNMMNNNMNNNMTNNNNMMNNTVHGEVKEQCTIDPRVSSHLTEHSLNQPADDNANHNVNNDRNDGNIHNDEIVKKMKEENNEREAENENEKEINKSEEIEYDDEEMEEEEEERVQETQESESDIHARRVLFELEKMFDSSSDTSLPSNPLDRKPDLKSSSLSSLLFSISNAHIDCVKKEKHEEKEEEDNNVIGYYGVSGSDSDEPRQRDLTQSQYVYYKDQEGVSPTTSPLKPSARSKKKKSPKRKPKRKNTSSALSEEEEEEEEEDEVVLLQHQPSTPTTKRRAEISMICNMINTTHLLLPTTGPAHSPPPPHHLYEPLTLSVDIPPSPPPSSSSSLLSISSKRVFAFSMISIDQKQEFEGFVLEMGGVVVEAEEDFKDISCVIAGKLSRSSKILAALAAGKWILHPSYLTDCIQAQCWVDERAYEWNEENYPAELSSNSLLPLPRRWRRTITHNRLKSLKAKVPISGPFSGFRVILWIKEHKSVLKLLMEIGLAVVLSDDPPPYSSDLLSNATHVIIEEGFVTKDQMQYVKQITDKNVLTVSPRFISDRLVKFPPPPIERYFVFRDRKSHAKPPQ